MKHSFATPLRWAQAGALAAGLVLAACSGDSVESLLASGQALSAKKDHKGAIIQFKTALQKDPQSGEARFLLGKALLDASDPNAATVELARALDQNVEASRVVPLLAKAYLLTGEYQKITSQYGDLDFKDLPALASLKASVATAWAAQGDKSKTLAATEAALRAVPKYPPALVLQARIQAGQGEFDRAVALVEEALQADATLHDAWHLKGEILALGKSDLEKAVEAFRKSLSLEPAYLPSHLALITERINARDLPGAQTQLAALRKVLPRHPQTLYVDAKLAFGAGDLKRTRELTQLLMRGLPDHTGVLQLAGAVEARLGSLILAESHFTKALQLNPKLLAARRSLGQVYLRLGQPQKALDALQPLVAAGVRDPETYSIAGEAHLRLGNAGAAEVEFKKALSLRPDNLRLRTALAMTHFTRGDADTGFNELEAIAGSSKTDTFADQAIVSARLSRREYDSALKAADVLVSKVPRDAAAVELRGRIQGLRKDYVAARKDFERALEIDPAYFSATASLAGLDMLEKKPDQARSRLEGSLSADPKNYFARLALADLGVRTDAPLDAVKTLLVDGIKLTPTEPMLRLQLIEVLLAKRQFKEALAAAQEASAALPNDKLVLDAVGRAQMEAGDVEQSVSTFRRLADVDPRSPMPHLRLADVYRATKRLPAAEAALRRALEIDPSLLRAQEALAALMLNADRLADVAELARKMQAQRPRAFGGYVLEATVLFRQKQIEPALATYRRGLAVKDRDPELARQYYVALQRLGRIGEADQFGVTWLKANPNDLSFEYQLGVAAMQRKDYPQAERRYLRVVQSLPENAMALNNLAWVMTSQGKVGGVAFAQRALDLVPGRPEFMDTLASALALEKQPAKALEIQKKVVELRPTEPGYRLSLARIALEAGDKALARAELDRLKALGASYPQQAEVTALAQKL